MGYIVHHAIVVCGPLDGPHLQNKPSLPEVREKMYEIAQGFQMGSLISPVVRGVANAVGSVLVGWDGSKEGWSTSEDADRMREEIVKYLNSLRYTDDSTSFHFVEVMFAGDSGEQGIVNSSDH